MKIEEIKPEFIKVRTREQDRLLESTGKEILEAALSFFRKSTRIVNLTPLWKIIRKALKSLIWEVAEASKQQRTEEILEWIDQYSGSKRMWAAELTKFLTNNENE